MNIPFTIPDIRPPQADASSIQAVIDNKTKPPGALGQLEDLAVQLASICSQDQAQSISIRKPCMLVFAADHGIAAEDISIAPQLVTQQMVHNFLAQGAAINCFAALNHMQLKVIDAGVLEAIDHPSLINQRVGKGSANFVEAPAITESELQQCFEFSQQLVEQLHQTGCNVIALGEMGIGNTSSAAALMAAYLGLPISDCVGRGTGINDQQFARKTALLNQALSFHQAKLDSPLEILRRLGGFEIAQMTAAMLYAAALGKLILVDGFIASAAALAAVHIQPAVRDYMVFCHSSEEAGHQRMLQHLQAKPLLQLGMRLGEGTGAALAMNLIYAAQSFYNDMASFEHAGIDAV